jgi:hypothetical protein
VRQVVLLGPQRFQPTLRSVVDELGVNGRIAAVTAGWQEREEDDAELSDHLGGRVVNLLLHRRGEEASAAEPGLFARLRRRQERLKRLQALYRVRLDPQLTAVRRLYDREGGDVLDGERAHAIELVRALDEHHLSRVRVIHAEDDVPWPAPEEGRGRYPELERHRAEIARILEGCAALAIAGGHVAVLLNRLRLFRVLELAPELPVFAWSAGAMALAERIVLFHDHPPQGAGNAEVLDVGLGVLGPDLAGEALLPLPHAGLRLRLGDPERVGIFARRFAPLAPVTLDPGARLVLGGGRVREAAGSERLLPGGGRAPVAGAAGGAEAAG